MTKKHLIPILLLIAALAVAACGGSDEESTTSAEATTAEAATTEQAVGGGEAVCDQATFDEWVKGYGENQGTEASLPEGQYKCADGWAVLFPNVGAAGEEVTETVVVQAEGAAWALMDRASVCGDDAASSEVPESLYQDACQTN